jgi:cytochrome c peroxidase
VNRTLIIAALLAASAGGAAFAAAVQTVDQKGIAFSVTSLTLAKGSFVRFLNSDATAHNITIAGPGGVVNGGLQQPGQVFKAPFMKPGSYQVICGIHPKMKLSVVVK